ncbi:DLW-39 family protein [Pseudonocardia sp. N23]|nr:DLW-39 family protein [Pseudonocardia sp. N23]
MISLKKFIALAIVAAGAALLVVAKLRGRDEEDLWHEATTR